MQKEHYLYIYVFQGIGASILNFFINTGIAVVMFYSIKVIPLWGFQSIMADLLGTIFILTFITSLIVTPMTHKTIALGKLSAPEWKRNSNLLLNKLPDKILHRAVVFAITFFFIFTPVVILSIKVSGIKEMELWNFIIFKGIFASVLAIVVTPIIALTALGDDNIK